jgi:phosphohistidine phosphatase SixA
MDALAFQTCWMHHCARLGIGEQAGTDGMPTLQTGPRHHGHDVSMRYIELRRHTDNDGDQLSEQGVADAEEIGRTELHPPYAAFVSSGAERATAMLRILRRAAGQDEIPITTETGLRSSVEDRWREAAKAAGKGASIEEMRAVDADLVDHETRLLGSALQRVVEGLPNGARALVVGHSPTNEAAVSGLVGQTIAAMGEGAGVLVVEDGGRYEVRRL